MSKIKIASRQSSRVDAEIVELLQATRGGDLITEKCLLLTAENREPRAEPSIDPRRPCEMPSERDAWSRTNGVSISYTIEPQKELAGASNEFDVRQAGSDDPT